MTYLEAAYQILSVAKEPLHYADIAQRALDRGLITPTGRTPTATMGSRLYTDTLKEETRFVRVGRGVFELAHAQAGGIDGQVRVLNEATRLRLRELLGAMPPERFEALITELLIQMGFDESTVQVTPFAGDGGIDVTGIYRAAGLTEVNAAVQVKRWKRNIQAPVVTQLRGSLQVHQQGIIITTSSFSKGAQAEATALNKTRIGLINGTELLELLIKHRVGVTEKTLRVIGLDDEWWGELLGEEAEPARPEAAEVVPAGAGSPAGRKPTAVTLLGETHAVASWKAVLMTVCAVLAERHGTDFAEKVLTLRGRKRSYFGRSAEGMTRGEALGASGLWVETNFSAQDILKVVRLVMDALGYEVGDVTIR